MDSSLWLEEIKVCYFSNMQFETETSLLLEYSEQNNEFEYTKIKRKQQYYLR
jgi:hypothetical protein